MNTKRKIILVVTIFAILLTSAMGWSAELPFGKSFHYNLLLDGKEIGTFVITSGEPREEDGKEVLDISRLQAFDNMPGFPPGSRVVEKVTIELPDMKPILYLVDQDLKIQRSKVMYEFDYEASKIFVTQQMGENKITIEDELPEGVVDGITADILPFTWELEEGREYEIKVVGLGTVTYKVIGKETISTPLGDFPAMKLETKSATAKSTTWYLSLIHI